MTQLRSNDMGKPRVSTRGQLSYDGTSRGAAAGGERHTCRRSATLSASDVAPRVETRGCQVSSLCDSISRAGVTFLLALLLTTSAAHSSDPIIGFTEPFVTIDLAASETGTLSQLNVQRGARVNASQLIGSLDSEVLRANREIAQARLDSQAKLNAANIRFHQAQRNLEKLEQAQSEGFGGKREVEIAASDLELTQTDQEAIRDEARISELTIKRIEAEIRRRQLISPINGVITKIHREVGEFVAATDPSVVTIVDLNQLRIRFYPSSAQAEELRVDQQVTVRFVHSDSRVRGRIEFIAPVIDADSDTLQVDVLLNNAEGLFRSGRRCVFELRHASETQTPATAIDGHRTQHSRATSGIATSRTPLTTGSH